VPATADPSAPVFPSADEVERSRQGAAGTATEVGRMEAQLAAAGARTDRLALEVGQAVEAYNGARFRLLQAQQDAMDAQRSAADARTALETSRNALGQLAAAAYRSGGDAAGLSAFLLAADPHDLMSRMSALQSIGDNRRQVLDEFRAAQAHATVLEARAQRLVEQRRASALRVERAKAEAEQRLAGQQLVAAEIATQRETLVRALAAARNTTVSLERARQDGLERQREEAARVAAEARAREQAREAAREAARAAAREQAREAARKAEADRQADETRRADEARQADDARRAAEARGAEAARTAAEEARRADDASRTPEKSSVPDPAPAPEPKPEPKPEPAPAPPPSSNGAEAVDRAIDFARSQIGLPYQWGADGPGSYDCSGLTMRAWEQGGIGLPHYSVAQYERSTKVPVTELRRGDLVFFGSDPGNHRSIYHVGLYVGDGQMIEAPYTGETVRVSSIWRGSLFGAARP
jgi:cell wall-associated NlpC family hydrolase